MDKSGSGQPGKNMNSKVTFKEALRGYNKDDVNAYLEEMNLRFSSVEANYRQTISNQKQTIDGLEFKIETYDQLRDELAQLKEKLVEKDSRFEANRKKFEEYEQLMSDLNVKIGKLTADSDEVSEKLSSANAENSMLIDENADLNKSMQALRDELAERDKIIKELKAESDELRKNNKTAPDVSDKHTDTVESGEKERFYDEMSRKLGNLMILANENAEKLVADAKAESEKIIAKASVDAEKVRADAVSESEALRDAAKAKLEDSLDSANRKLFSMSEDYIRSYAEYLRSVQGEFETMISGMREKSGEIKNKVDTMRAMIGDELELEFQRIDQDMHSDTDGDIHPVADTAEEADTKNEKI